MFYIRLVELRSYEHLNLHPVKAFLKICSKPKNFKTLRLTVGWNLNPPLYGPRALLNCTRYPRLTWTWFLSSSQTTRNWMTLSGMETILRAVRYSGFFSKRVEFSRVEASSEEIFVSRLLTCESAQRGTNHCKLARTQAQMEG